MILHSRIELLEILPRHAKVAEIGVFQGVLSAQIMRFTNPNHLWLIDPWRWPNQMGGKWHGLGGAGKLPATGEETYLGVVRRFWEEPAVSIIRTSSFEAAPLFEDEFFDWLHIDGDHEFGACFEDVTIWTPKVKPGGYVTGHDLQNPSVRRAVEKYIVKNPQYELSYTEESGPTSWWFQKPQPAS